MNVFLADRCSRLPAGWSETTLALTLAAVLAAPSAVVADSGAEPLPTASARPGPDKAKPRTVRKTQLEPVRGWAFSRLRRSHDALAAEDFATSERELGEMRDNENLNSHERAMMWQTYGYLYATRGEQQKAAEAFAACLAEGGLPLKTQRSVESNLAQIYLMLGQYGKAIEGFESWFAAADEAPPASAHYMLALAYAQSDDMVGAMPHAEIAVERSPEPHEGRLQLLSAIYFRLQRYPELLGVLETLTENFSKKSYWMQLSAIYVELGETDKAVGAQELVFEQGWMNAHREYVTLARLLLQAGVPFEAAQVLERGFAQGHIDENEESWDLLASAYLQAREYATALAPLERAAEAATSGAVYVRLGEVYLGEEDWAAARRALDAGIRKGRLDDPGRAFLLLGIANANERRFDEAHYAFAEARKFDQVAETARQWLAHVERERQTDVDGDSPGPVADSQPAAPATGA